MIIDIIGNDGSGKTAVAERLFDTQKKSKQNVIFRREFEYFYLDYVKRIFRRTYLKKVQSDIQQENSSSFLKRISPYLVYIDLLLEHVYFRVFRRKFTVIKDRCAPDYLISWEEQGISNTLISFLYSHFPKPDLAFFVYADPAIAYQRRKEQVTSDEKDQVKDIPFYRQKTDSYVSYCDQKPIIFIDNTVDIDTSIQEIIHFIDLKEKLSSVKSLAISGLDGAGKSTTIDNLSNLLYKLHIPSTTIHFYYNYIILKFLRQFQKQKKTSDQDNFQKSIAHEKKSVREGKPTWWVYFVLADSFIQYFFIRLFSLRKVIIYDRFFHDYLVSFAFLNAPHDRERLLQLLPKPNNYFLQIADPEILHDRKPEHTMDFFKTCHAAYMQLATRCNFHLLDSGKYNEKEILDKLLSYELRRN